MESDHQPSKDGPVLRGAKQVLTFVGLLPSDSEQDLIKRVIGVSGDTVECCDDQGRVSVNGTPIDEPYLAAGNPPSRQPFKVKVPQGRLWVMGDHRDVSADSRFHMGNPGQGTIPLSGVVGRAFTIVWPVDRINQLDAPSSLSKLAKAPQAVAVRRIRRARGRFRWNLRSLWVCWASFRSSAVGRGGVRPSPARPGDRAGRACRSASRMPGSDREVLMRPVPDNNGRVRRLCWCQVSPGGRPRGRSRSVVECGARCAAL
ncbi:signal peptidase I [Kitasatospora aburaviensis]